MIDGSSILRRVFERLGDLRRERFARADVRGTLAADAAVGKATALRLATQARTHVATWRARPRSDAPGVALPRWQTALRAMTITLAALLILVLGGIVYFAFEIPIDGGTTSDAQGALTVDAADGSVLAARGTAHGEQLTYDEISPNLRKAIVAVEDRRFFSHGAVDLHGMLRATVHDMTRGHAQGASTITQQLARLMLLSNERTLRRKMQEALIAVWLEHHLTKREILARYLDAAYFGAGAYGADAAAERYFGRSARDLTLPQAAMIAGLVRAPSALAPVKNLEGAQARAGVVLHAMVETGAITRAEADAAVASPAVLEVPPDLPPGPGYVADAAQADIKGLVGGGALDLTARTTIDAKIEAAAEAAVETHLAGEGARRHATQAAVVAIGPNGAILAMVGGRDYATSTFNRATQAQRQPGSLFKLFVYLAALKAGATPDTIVDDAPVTIGTGPDAWQPHDFEDRYEGRMPLSLAFAKSVNTVAANLGQKVGIKTVIATARDLGVTSPLPDVPSLALGTANVTLLEMTRAYRDRSPPTRIVWSPTSYSASPPTARCCSTDRRATARRPTPRRPSSTCASCSPTSCARGRAATPASTFPTGGKTGTTQDFRDAWFIGSAPDITIGVWVGNDDDSAMDRVTGGDLPAKIWRDVAVVAEAGHKATRRPARRAPAAPQMSQQTPPPTPRATPDLGDAIVGAVTDATHGIVNGLTQPDAATSGDDTDAAGAVSGQAQVVDTATLGIDGKQIHLQGVAPGGGRAARALARYLRRRDVECAPAAGAGSSTSGMSWRCSVDGDDLATTILSNGGAEATADAPADLAAAQETAQDERLGLWRGRR